MVKLKEFWAMLPKKDRALYYISWSVKLAILIAFISALFTERIAVAGLALFALIISFTPSIMKRRFKIILPPEFETLFALFLFGSLILGELNDFYVRFVWWDLMLHSLSAIMIALIGFMIVYSIYYTHKVVFDARFAALFGFCFALAIGALWEVFEFSVDYFFGLNMQKSGLIDTMIDLMLDILGAAIVSISGYFYLKGGDSFLMERFVKKYIKLNEDNLKKKEKDII